MTGSVIAVGYSKDVVPNGVKRAEEQSVQKSLLNFLRGNTDNKQDAIEAVKIIKKFNINKPPQDQIELISGGVVNDKHFYPHRRYENKGLVYTRATIGEVNLFASEELEKLNAVFNTNVKAGALGENILTSNIDIDNLTHGTILKIGSTAQIKILARRSFCYKFVNVFFPESEIWSVPDIKKIDKNRIGVLGQVIQAGIVRPNDQIEIVEVASHVSLKSIEPPNIYIDTPLA
jgi:hypothetical protein